MSKRTVEEAKSKIKGIRIELDDSYPAEKMDLELEYEREDADPNILPSSAKQDDFYKRLVTLEEIEAKKMERAREDLSERTDIELRKSYANNILVLVLIVISLTSLFLGKVASGAWFLSEKVLISVLLALVLEVIGLVLIVTNYLFKSNEPKRGKGKPAPKPNEKNYTF